MQPLLSTYVFKGNILILLEHRVIAAYIAAGYMVAAARTHM